MNIGELRSFLKSLPRDRVIADLDARVALNAVMKITNDPELEKFSSFLMLGLIMRQDPEEMCPNEANFNFGEASAILSSADYAVTVGEWLEAVSRFKLTRKLSNDFVVFNSEYVFALLEGVMLRIEQNSLEKAGCFKSVVEFLGEMNDRS